MKKSRDVMTIDPYCCLQDEDNKIIGIIFQRDVALRLNDPETTGAVVAEISE